MATKKRMKPKAAPKTASKKPRKTAPNKSAKKSASRKSPPPKKRASPAKKAAVTPNAPRPKTFAEKVRDRDVGTQVWYRVGDAVTYGTIRGDGAAGNVSVLSNGMVNEVPAGNLFETQAAAQAAR